MKIARRLILMIFLVSLYIGSSALYAYAESILTMPDSTVIIDEEAFCEMRSFDAVILPEGIKEIKKRAFAGSSVKYINLPASITFIANDAFDGSSLMDVIASEGTYSYNWAVNHSYIDVCPVNGRIYHFAGITNPDHYCTYGEPADLSARMTSSVALKKIRASVVYRGGFSDGQKVCPDVIESCGNNVFSFDTISTDLEYGINCESLPLGKYRLILSAELIDGRKYNVCEYDFEILNRCSAVTLIDSRYQIACGGVSMLYPVAEPSSATYSGSFHYSSSDPTIVTVDESGFMYAGNKSGRATVTIYSGDWYASTSCEITVFDEGTQFDCPVNIQVWSNAGSGNPGHYHQYGKSEEFTGKITSSVAIKEIRPAVVYRGGENDGCSAYDCSKAIYTGGANTYSINIGSSVLNTKIKFGQMPCASLRLFLYAELVDGSVYQIYKYDFEIVNKCTSITLNRYEKLMPYGSTFQLIPSVSPSGATHKDSFHYKSDAPYYASVNTDGLVQCYDRKGSATITVYSEDWAVSTKCIVTVTGNILDGTPRIIGATSNSAIYESLYDRSIWLNFTPVNGAYLYDLYRATSANGPFEMLGSTDGSNECEWWTSPYTSGCTALDNDCGENIVYYYKIQARAYNGTLSDFSNIMVAHSGENHEPVWIDSTIDEVPDYVDGADSYKLRVNGMISSNCSLSRIAVSIMNEWKTTVHNSYFYPQNKSYPLNNLSLNLSGLPSGLYKIIIEATANGESDTVVSKWFSLNNPTAQVTTSQLQQDIIQFVKTRSSNIFIPESEVQSYFNQMGTWDIILMGLSDYQGIASSAIKDLLSGSDYSSYMKMKYESQIIKLLDVMYEEGKIEEIDISSSVTDFIKDLNDLTKEGSSFNINEINNVFLSNAAKVDWDQLGTLLIIKEGCKRLDDVFDYIEGGSEFIQMVCELFSDHSRDLEALNIISELYNPNHDPAFSAALERVRNSYKTQFGSSLRMLFDKIEKELRKEVVKKITRTVLNKTVGSLYTLADTIAELSVKFMGVEDAGKTRLQFLVRYNTLANMRQAFMNAHAAVLSSINSGGALPTTNQITQLQTAFIIARQSLIQLYETMEELDNEENIGIYEYYIDQAKKLIMPGVERIR